MNDTENTYGLTEEQISAGFTVVLERLTRKKNFIFSINTKREKEKYTERQVNALIREAERRAVEKWFTKGQIGIISAALNVAIKNMVTSKENIDKLVDINKKLLEFSKLCKLSELQGEEKHE